MMDFPANYGWLTDLLDIGLVAFIIYRGILLIKGTLAHRIIIVLTVLLGSYLFSRIAGFDTLNWIVGNLLGSLMVVLAIIFQHDLRRAVFAFSRNRAGEEKFSNEIEGIIDELTVASEYLATRKIGALVVIEQSMSIGHYLVVGTEIDARVNRELITSIFLPYSPIHDGAVIIQRGKLTKAGCFLPLTQNPAISKTMGTRWSLWYPRRPAPYP
jgi:DNA integrity scanning protein DisA with diadenylate cyclase activity